MASFLMGSLLCYLRIRNSGGTTAVRRLAASLLLAAIAVLVKETALILPALIFSYEWIFHRHDATKRTRFFSAVRAAIPFAAVSCLFLLIRALALHSLAPAATRVGRLSVLLAWPKAIAFYMGHTLFPVHLSVFYNLFRVTHPGPQNFVLGIAAMSAGAALLYYGSRRSQVLTFFSMWCAIMLIPILNVTLWDNVENVHDRYLYLPSAAVCVMLASLLARLKELGHRTTMASVLVGLASAYAVVTVSELQYWKNDYVLGEHGITVSPGHPIALQLIGNAYIREGKITEALPYLLDSLSARPNDIDTLSSLAFCYSELNALTLAEEYASKAIAIRNSKPRSHLLLGIVRLKQNRLAESEFEIRRGIELEWVKQALPLYHYYLGNVLYAKGDVRGAQLEYQLELRNDPQGDPAAEPAHARLEEVDRQLQVDNHR
jgi:tetratricopeptide (TPR) repeat protein